MAHQSPGGRAPAHPSPGPSAHTHARVTVQRPLTVPPHLIKSTLPHHQAPPCCWYVCDKSVWPFDISDKLGHAPFGQHARIFHIIEGPNQSATASAAAAAAPATTAAAAAAATATAAASRGSLSTQPFPGPCAPAPSPSPPPRQANPTLSHRPQQHRPQLRRPSRLCVGQRYYGQDAGEA